MQYETEFKNNLKQKMKDKHLSDSSIRMYVRNLEKLNNDMPLKNFNFLKDIDSIMEKLERYKENTKRGYIISIVSSLSTDLSTKAKKKLYDEYFKIMITKNKALKESLEDNEMSETQKANWVSWEDVKLVYDDLRERVDKFVNQKEINENQYNILLAYMILSLYYYNPPRRNQDYQKMFLVKNYQPTMDDTENYLDFENKEFIFNVYKTSKKEGQQKVKINEELFNVINQYIKHHPHLKGKKPGKIEIPFLVYYNGSMLDKVNSITRILNKIFGKSVGSSMLRHSFLSSKYGDVLKQQKEDSFAMGHSLNQQRDYIKGENKDESF